MKIKEVSNGKLLELCKFWGKQALSARNKFLGLLPEVNRRKLYEKKFVSIFHFAAVMAGVSREQVSRVLNLEKSFTHMPSLLELLVNGIVSVNKLARIVSIVTTENEEELAQLVQTLSKPALETFVRDILVAKAQENESQIIESEIADGLFEPQIDSKSVPGHKQQRVCESTKQQRVPAEAGSNEIMKLQNAQQFEYVSNPPLNNIIKKKLNELAAMDIDINDLIEKALIRREQELAEDKQAAAEKAEAKLIEQIVEEKIISSVVPVATKGLLKREYGTKCAVPFCNKPSQEIHHTNRFSLSLIHDPHYMAPLCKQHHQIAHAIDVKVVSKRHH